MMNFEIKNRWTSEVIFSCELPAELAGMEYRFQLGFAVKKAAAAKADLRNADLSDADLRNADLRGADLSDADLRGANLSGAYLRNANLSDADLRGADLSDADLSDADLSDANLSDADLRGANLSDAYLRNANLSDADLSDANLRNADLRDADLRGANLSGAYLRNADLRDAKNIPESWLVVCRDDIWAVLSAAPMEVSGLRKKLIAGEVDGSCYEGECACLVGTIANLRGKNYASLQDIKPNSSRPAEQYFTLIQKGDTPETNEAAKNVLGWIDTWHARMVAAFGPQVSA